MSQDELYKRIWGARVSNIRKWALLLKIRQHLLYQMLLEHPDIELQNWIEVNGRKIDVSEIGDVVVKVNHKRI